MPVPVKVVVAAGVEQASAALYAVDDIAFFEK